MEETEIQKEIENRNTSPQEKIEKILNILNYIGAIGAGIMTIAYIVVVCVLIKGFKEEAILQTTIFAIVSAGVGLCITQFLKVQGQSFGEMVPDNKSIIEQYYGTKTKDKKNHHMRYFWITSVTKDVIIKATTVAAGTIGIIYIVIQGSNDYSLLALAVVNLLMFFCFGLLSMNKAYQFVNRSYIPYLKEQIKASTVDSEKEKDECLNLETKSSETCKNK